MLAACISKNTIIKHNSRHLFFVLPDFIRMYYKYQINFKTTPFTTKQHRDTNTHSDYLDHFNISRKLEYLKTIRCIGSIIQKKSVLLTAAIAFLGTDAISDSPEHYQLNFQDSASPLTRGIHELHHDIMFFLLVFFGMIVYMLLKTTTTFVWYKNAFPDKFSRNTKLEIAWTLVPVILLSVISLPSLALIYAIDDAVRNPKISIKVIGHQWYWTYEYSEFELDDKSVTFDSYMVPDDELAEGELRLLEVDNRLVVPVNSCVRLLVTASDVIHSWAVPSLGLKVDAIPGRLNVASFQTLREGVYYGQCSELCGTHHGFMPIVVESVSNQDFLNWLHEFLER